MAKSYAERGSGGRPLHESHRCSRMRALGCNSRGSAHGSSRSPQLKHQVNLAVVRAGVPETGGERRRAAACAEVHAPNPTAGAKLEKAESVFHGMEGQPLFITHHLTDLYDD